MFDRIAGVYDLLNTVMTAGLHHSWRERAVDRAEVGPGSDALDLCCGTGGAKAETGSQMEDLAHGRGACRARARLGEDGDKTKVGALELTSLRTRLQETK